MSDDDVEAFVFDEAELLDTADVDGWLSLFTHDAVYWVPLDTSRDEPRGGVNLIYDDRTRLEDRMRRLRSGASHSEDPLSRTSHLVGNVRVLSAEHAAPLVGWAGPTPGEVVVRARMVVARTRRATSDLWHGRVTWLLSPGDGRTRFKIRVKRIDLLNADQPLPPMTFLL